MIIPCFIVLTLAGPFAGNKQIMVNANSIHIGDTTIQQYTEVIVRHKTYTVKESYSKIKELIRKECN